MNKSPLPVLVTDSNTLFTSKVFIHWFFLPIKIFFARKTSSQIYNFKTNIDFNIIVLSYDNYLVIQYR